MKIYKFPKQHMGSIMAHISAFEITVLSLVPNNDYYISELDCDQLPEGQYEHLQEQFGLEEVI